VSTAGAGVVNFLFSRDPRYVNDGCCGPRSRSAAKAAVGIKTRRLPPDLALIGGPDAAAGADPAAAMVVEPEEGGGLSLWSTLVEIQTVMSIPSFLIIIVQVRGRPALVAHQGRFSSRIRRGHSTLLQIVPYLIPARRSSHSLTVNLPVCSQCSWWSYRFGLRQCLTRR